MSSLGTMCSKMAEMYAKGQSIPQISASTGINQSRVRSELLKSGTILRTRSEALKIREGLGQHLIGRKRDIPQEWRDKISTGRRDWADKYAVGTSIKPSGYVEFTRGLNKGRSQHVVVMERHIGRSLRPDEVVHHIDRDRTNNDINNLALLTRSGHSRLHRFEDKLEGKERKRVNGRFS